MAAEPQAAPDTKAALLELIGDVFGLLDIDEMRWGLLASLQRVIPSNWVSLNDVGPEPGEVVSIIVPEVEDSSLFEVWERLAHQNPLLRRHLDTHDGRAYRFSDVVTPEELHALEIYKELYAPMDVEHQMAFILPSPEGRVLGVALNRGDRDFSDAERDLVNEARPFLIQAYVNALTYSHLRDNGAAPDAEILPSLLVAGFTPREAEVLRLLALGGSNRHIATTLGISARTVAKHLENGFRKLGVGDRSAAAQRVWTIAREGHAEGARRLVHEAAIPIPDARPS